MRQQLPLWVKYAITLSVFIPLAIATAIFLHDQMSAPAPTAPPAPSKRTAEAVMERDQAVRRAAYSRALAPAVALERAIVADVRERIAHHELSGPAGRVNCVALARHVRVRLAFSCRASAGGFTYPFRGVVDLATRALAWCKDDNISAAGSLRVPLNPACTD